MNLEVRRGEVVGLIGANGAGKSTTMNAIGGFVRGRGQVELLGHDVTGAPAHRRARLGLGRTFQDAALFADLTVRETVDVALETRARADITSVALALPRARRVERAKRARADEILMFLGLGPYGERFLTELSTARGASLSSPASSPSTPGCSASASPRPASPSARPRPSAPCCSGSARSSTRRCCSSPTTCPSSWRSATASTASKPATSSPRVLPRMSATHPAVVASYLGTDERVIQRSGAAVTAPT